MGLLALMLLQDSRRAARTSPTGDLILLGRPGPLALEPGSDRGRSGAGGTGAVVAPVRPVHRSKRRSRRCMPQAPSRRRHGLGPDRRTLRPADAGRSVARGRVESRCGGGDARRPVGGSCAHRRHPRAGRSGGTITWRMRRGRISAGDSGERRRPEPPTNKRSRLTQQEPERRFLRATAGRVVWQGWVERLFEPRRPMSILAFLDDYLLSTTLHVCIGGLEL